MKKPSQYLFDEFFLSGLEPSISPFLTNNSRKWCRNLGLKSSIFAAILLILSFIFIKINYNLSYLGLSIIYFLVGIPALLVTYEDLKKFQININVLMTVSAFVAVGIGRPYEGALLLVLFGISNAMENALSYKTTNAIHNLNKISPTKAFLMQEDGSIHEKSIKEIKINDHILIKSGEIIPLDGIVIDGTSSINLAHLTGETTSVTKKINDIVHAGSRNLEGTLTIKVTKTGSESTLNQIIKLISEAQSKKPKLERAFSTFGKIYSSLIMLSSVFFALIMPLIFPINYLGMEGSIYRSLAFLIAASPCALIIAIPTAYLSAINSCAQKGIILKGGTVLDGLYRIKQIAFDKTGTLTQAKLHCTEILHVEKNKKNKKNNHLDIEKVKLIAASLEKGSTHPIAEAFLSLIDKNISFLPIKNYKSIPGYGIEGEVKVINRYLKVFIGLPEYIENTLSDSRKKMLSKIKKDTLEKGEIISILHIDNELFIFKFRDTLRHDMKKVISDLKIKLKLKTLILTGDRKPNADLIAKQIDIKEVYAELKPKDKLECISDLTKKEKLAMVGDGINDAPSLARADVGISMGKIGSATAVDASDVILLNDDITSLPWLFKKAKYLRRIIRENLTLALLVIACASIPALLGFIPLWLAVSLHEGGTLLIGLNSLRLIKVG